MEKISNALDISLSELFSNQENLISYTDSIEENIIFEIRELSEKERSEILNIVKHVIKFKKG